MLLVRVRVVGERVCLWSVSFGGLSLSTLANLRECNRECTCAPSGGCILLIPGCFDRPLERSVEVALLPGRCSFYCCSSSTHTHTQTLFKGETVDGREKLSSADRVIAKSTLALALSLCLLEKLISTEKKIMLHISNSLEQPSLIAPPLTHRTTTTTSVGSATLRTRGGEHIPSPLPRSSFRLYVAL